MRGLRAIPREALSADPRTVARDVLLGAILVRLVGGRCLPVRLVETEAYLGEQDPGSHAFRGRTERNRIMYGPPGHAYVYFSYGTHWMLNVVARPEGTAGAVLLRGAEPLAGTSFMIGRREKRSAVPRQAQASPQAPGPDTEASPRLVHWLCGGPARLAQALAVDRSDYGLDMVAGDLGGAFPSFLLRGFLLLEGPPAKPETIVTTTRVGLSQGADLPYRYYLADSAAVSRR